MRIDNPLHTNLSLFLLQVDPNDVKMGFNRDGRPSGDALVTFPSSELAKSAVREKNRKHLGRRYVELFIES